MKRTIVLAALAAVLSLTCAHAQEITDKDVARARDLVARMTLDEKLEYITGYNEFSIRAIPRLGIPEIRMSDGPQGVRTEAGSTCYPTNLLTAATWNRALAYSEGQGIATDCKARGIQIILGPGVNIYRSPLSGRSFEYMGEDPFLTSEIAVQYIKGVQENGVMACVKHFAGNNQEWDRNYVSSDIDERTLNEIYFPAFRKAVTEAKVGSVMDSYNLINGVWATENRYMNIDRLRNAWGFKGILMSDWWAVHNPIAPVLGGMDLEMPSGASLTKENLMPALESGVITMNDIDRMVTHIVSTISAFGWLDKSTSADKSIAEDNAESSARALDIAREGIVLLKNAGNVLPLKGHTVVMGPNADVRTMGGGSGVLYPFHYLTEWEGIKAALGKKATLATIEPRSKAFPSSCFSCADGTEGFDVEWYGNRNFEGPPVRTKAKEIAYTWAAEPCEGIGADNFTTRVRSTFTAPVTGEVMFKVKGDDGYRLFIDGKLIFSEWTDHEAHSQVAWINVVEGQKYDIVVEEYEGGEEGGLSFSVETLDEASVTCPEFLGQFSKADNIVVCLGWNSNTDCEGSDHPFGLPAEQQILLREASKLGKKVILVINSGCNVDIAGLEPYADAVLMAWYPGQEGGTALADILTGKVNPSGKLPISLEKCWEDNPCHNSYHCLKDDNGIRRVRYTEGIFTGYRGYDKSGTEVAFPFGYGLSYTTFGYSDIKAEVTAQNEVTVSFTVTNTGKMDGKEVCQVYVSDTECSVARPVKELKGFEKIDLKKGESKRVSIVLGSEAFHYFDVNCHEFVVEPGEFVISVGGSSDNLPLKASITL